MVLPIVAIIEGEKKADNGERTFHHEIEGPRSDARGMPHYPIQLGFSTTSTTAVLLTREGLDKDLHGAVCIETVVTTTLTQRWR